MLLRSIPFTLLATGLLCAPAASAQYTCTQNTALASAFTVASTVTCTATNQASFDACLADVATNPSATIIKISPGTYTMPFFSFTKDVCIEVRMGVGRPCLTYFALLILSNPLLRCPNVVGYGHSHHDPDVPFFPWSPSYPLSHWQSPGHRRDPRRCV